MLPPPKFKHLQATHPASPGSPFSAKHQRWTGIVQQVQDTSTRLNTRRRQSTEAAAAAAVGPSLWTAQHNAPGEPRSAAGADGAVGRRGSLQVALDQRAVAEAAAAAATTAAAGTDMAATHGGSFPQPGAKMPRQQVSPFQPMHNT